MAQRVGEDDPAAFSDEINSRREVACADALGKE
jgi:hypothetical protein